MRLTVKFRVPRPSFVVVMVAVNNLSGSSPRVKENSLTMPVSFATPMNVFVGVKMSLRALAVFCDKVYVQGTTDETILKHRKECVLRPKDAAEEVLPGSVTFVSLVLRQGIRPPMKPTVGVVRHSIKLAACAPKLSKLSVFVLHLHTSRHVEVPSVLISSA